MKTALIFGLGYVGAHFSRRLCREGWQVTAVVRQTAQFSRVRSLGVEPIALDEIPRLEEAVQSADTLLITAPPTAVTGCPGLNVLRPALEKSGRAQWVGYLSSTAVYGDQACRLTDETAEMKATSPEGIRRLAAEKAWVEFADDLEMPLNIFRLSGIYGPGRSAIDRVRAGTARRIVKPGHVVSRIHVDDIVEVLRLSLAHCDGGECYNVSDHEPSPPQDVITYAARLLNVSPSPEESFLGARMSEDARRFFEACRKISSRQAYERLGWEPRFPSYREGLEAVMALDNGSSV